MADAAVSAGFAAWLKAEQRMLPVAVPGATRWPRGRTIAVATPFATVEGAQAEGARLTAFYAAPLVLDRAIVVGRRADLWGRCIAVDYARYGYAPGDLVFVIGAQELDNGTTQLTVLRRLAA
ncbi:hypothetical protein [Sphingomonas sp. DC2300-3]|uniref:hypothetical protein n=1 Tax=unclassified Sphingomonas TaxID=196159 RepID=UPI003CE7EC2D